MRKVDQWTSGCARSAATSRAGSYITLMTAGLVIVIWGLAGPALSGVFDQAIGRVLGF